MLSAQIKNSVEIIISSIMLSAQIKNSVEITGFYFDNELITIIIYLAGKVSARKGACINEYTRF